MIASKAKCLVFSFSTPFLEYWRIKSKKYFIDHRTAICYFYTAIQLFIATKGEFLDKDFLINVATYSFACR